jgi:hypothetical protein
MTRQGRLTRRGWLVLGVYTLLLLWLMTKTGEQLVVDGKIVRW